MLSSFLSFLSPCMGEKGLQFTSQTDDDLLNTKEESGEEEEG